VLREKAAVGKVTLESLVWRDGFEEWKPLREFPELATVVEEASAAAMATEALRTIPAPSPLEEQEERKRALESYEPSSEVLAKVGAKRSNSHPMAWVAMVVALALGVTIGAVLLSKTVNRDVIKYVEVPASAKSAEVAPSGGEVALEEATVAGGTTKRVGGPAAPKTEPSAPAAPAKGGLAGLSGLNGLSGLGPTAQGPDVAGPGSAPGGQLDGNSIQRVVGNFVPSVRRGCWDSALAGRAPDAPSSARVSATITINPNGNVDNVTTSGDPKGYPGLARCIESRVRSWHFPRSGGTTTANVPFVFAAQ
jgi:hypothetical protein